MYQETLTQDLKLFLQKNNYPIKAVVDYSEHEDFQYQSPLLFALNREKSFESSQLVSFLKETNHYEKIETTGKGFLSVKFNLDANAKIIEKKKEKVVVDYCGVNVAKQMHIGHIRSMFIGDFITRYHEYSGDDVVIYNHVGDWGNQFGFLLQYIIDFNLDIKDNKELTQYYKNSFKLFTENPEFAKKAHECAFALHNKSPELIKLWSKCVDISMSEAQNIFTTFDLKMNISNTQGESFYAPMCHSIEKELIEKNIAKTQDDGSLVVFLEGKSPLILKKSSGSYLYAMYDLAAIKWRMDNICPDKIVYVVDKRQSLHFEQVFEIAEKMTWCDKGVLLHCGFGTILGTDKKPLKTKSGEALYLDELLEQGYEALLKSEHFKDMDNSFKQEVLLKTIVGAMKYYDLKLNKQQDYIFDWNFVLNTKGNSAPYLQNAYVRIDSIFYKKYENNENKDNSCVNLELLSDIGKKIFFNCQKTYEIVSQLNENSYQSQNLTQQMMRLCQLFHSFYEKEKILTGKNENNNLCLLGFLKTTLEHGAQVLGISLYPCENKLKNKVNQKNDKNFFP